MCNRVTIHTTIDKSTNDYIKRLAKENCISFGRVLDIIAMRDGENIRGLRKPILDEVIDHVIKQYYLRACDDGE